MSVSATAHKATRKAPFWGTTKTPSRLIFSAAAKASSSKMVTKKPPSYRG